MLITIKIVAMTVFKTSIEGINKIKPGEGLYQISETVTTSRVLRKEDSGIAINVATDGLNHQLPLITEGNLGMKYMFRNIGADGNNDVSFAPNSVDAIFGTIANSAADIVAIGDLGEEFVNTKASSKKGDWCSVEAMALNQWYVTGGIGIWSTVLATDALESESGEFFITESGTFLIIE